MIQRFPCYLIVGRDDGSGIPLYILLDKIMILSEIYFWNKKRCQPLDREQ